MSSKLFICLFVFGLVCSVFGGQWQTEPYQHPDYPGQCYDKEINEPVPVGQVSSNSKGCKWQKCQPDFSFFVANCSPTGQPPGCTVTKPDFTKAYPKCCPQLICNRND